MLTESDIADNVLKDITENKEYKALFGSEAIVRTGKSFHFDPIVDGKAYSGTWHVFCAFYNYTDTTYAQDPIKTTLADAIEVTTSPKMNSKLIIWLLCGAGALLLVIIVVVLIFSIRREKVW